MKSGSARLTSLGDSGKNQTDLESFASCNPEKTRVTLGPKTGDEYGSHRGSGHSRVWSGVLGGLLGREPEPAEVQETPEKDSQRTDRLNPSSLS